MYIYIYIKIPTIEYMFQHLLPGDMFQKLLQLGWTENHTEEMCEKRNLSRMGRA